MTSLISALRTRRHEAITALAAVVTVAGLAAIPAMASAAAARHSLAADAARPGAGRTESARAGLALLAQRARVRLHEHVPQAGSITGTVLGAYGYSIYFEHIDLGQFIEQFTYWTDPKDYIIGATKAAVFGVTLSVAACFQGFNVRGGAKEVGLATTRAVVAGSVSVLISDYFLIDIFHILWPYQS